MDYNQDLVEKVRSVLKQLPENFIEKEMFGGISFMFEGFMTLGVLNNDIIVRVLSNKMETLLLSPYVRPMNYSGKILSEYIYVSKDGCKTDKELLKWISLGLEHAKSRL
ncbi:TfoX/Sxy family protein [Ascidiimonas sp. W6]|uniref:TfoX/Sxy family protein n=1 Tax=Ascidiimonas meishanensis TaxID=3128903 RepID=UPI0030EC84F4